MSSVNTGPNHTPILYARDSGSGFAAYVTSTNNKLDVNASVSISGSAIPASGLATALAVQIVDGSGNQVTSFGGGTQYTDAGTPPAHPVGPTLEWNNAGAWVTVGSAAPLPVSVGTVTVAGTSANLYVGQVTVNTTQVQVLNASHALTNGIVIKALLANSAAIYVGLTGVTSSTGDALEPGESRGYALNNTNLPYIISTASTTDKITYSAN